MVKFLLILGVFSLLSSLQAQEFPEGTLEEGTKINLKAGQELPRLGPNLYFLVKNVTLPRAKAESPHVDLEVVRVPDENISRVRFSRIPKVNMLVTGSDPIYQGRTSVIGKFEVNDGGVLVVNRYLEDFVTEYVELTVGMELNLNTIRGEEADITRLPKLPPGYEWRQSRRLPAAEVPGIELDRVFFNLQGPRYSHIDTLRVTQTKRVLRLGDRPTPSRGGGGGGSPCL